MVGPWLSASIGLGALCVEAANCVAGEGGNLGEGVTGSLVGVWGGGGGGVVGDCVVVSN